MPSSLFGNEDVCKYKCILNNYTTQERISKENKVKRFYYCPIQTFYFFLFGNYIEGRVSLEILETFNSIFCLFYLKICLCKSVYQYRCRCRCFMLLFQTICFWKVLPSGKEMASEVFQHEFHRIQSSLVTRRVLQGSGVTEENLAAELEAESSELKYQSVAGNELHLF